MLSIALLTQHVLYKLQSTGPIKPHEAQYKEALLLLYGLLLSLLSSGVFIAYLLILMNYRQLITPLCQAKWLFNLLLLLAAMAVPGAIDHKILFFSNPTAFDDAVSVNTKAFATLNVASFGTMLSNLLEHSLLFESLNNASLRLYVIAFISFLVAVMLYLRRDKLSVLLAALCLCGLLMEGLTLYSLLASILLLLVQKAQPLLNNRRLFNTAFRLIKWYLNEKNL